MKEYAMDRDEIIYQLAKAGGQLAVLVQDLSDVEGLSEAYKYRVHKLVCIIEDLDRKLHFADKWKHVLEAEDFPESCAHIWNYVYDDLEDNPVHLCSSCGRSAIGVTL